MDSDDPLDDNSSLDNSLPDLEDAGTHWDSDPSPESPQSLLPSSPAHTPEKVMLPDVKVLLVRVEHETKSADAERPSSNELHGCSDCGRTFKSLAGMQSHKKVGKVVCTRKSCPDCGRTFQSFAGLQIHRSVQHRKSISAVPIETKASSPNKARIKEERQKIQAELAKLSSSLHEILPEEETADKFDRDSLTCECCNREFKFSLALNVHRSQMLMKKMAAEAARKDEVVNQDGGDSDKMSKQAGVIKSSTDSDILSLHSPLQTSDSEGQGVDKLIGILDKDLEACENSGESGKEGGKTYGTKEDIDAGEEGSQVTADQAKRDSEEKAAVAEEDPQEDAVEAKMASKEDNALKETDDAQDKPEEAKREDPSKRNEAPQEGSRGNLVEVSVTPGKKPRRKRRWFRRPPDFVEPELTKSPVQDCTSGGENTGVSEDPKPSGAASDPVPKENSQASGGNKDPEKVKKPRRKRRWWKKPADFVEEEPIKTPKPELPQPAEISREEIPFSEEDIVLDVAKILDAATASLAKTGISTEVMEEGFVTPSTESTGLAAPSTSASPASTSTEGKVHTTILASSAGWNEKGSPPMLPSTTEHAESSVSTSSTGDTATAFAPPQADSQEPGSRGLAKYACSHCSRKFYKISSLRRHLTFQKRYELQRQAAKKASEKMSSEGDTQVSTDDTSGEPARRRSRKSFKVASQTVLLDAKEGVKAPIANGEPELSGPEPHVQRKPETEDSEFFSEISRKILLAVETELKAHSPEKNRGEEINREDSVTPVSSAKPEIPEDPAAGGDGDKDDEVQDGSVAIATEETSAAASQKSLGDSSTRYQCGGCMVWFPSAALYRSHRRSTKCFDDQRVFGHQLESWNHKCPICEKPLESVRAVSQHRKLGRKRCRSYLKVHCGPFISERKSEPAAAAPPALHSKFSCVVCGREFLSKRALDAHKRHRRKRHSSKTFCVPIGIKRQNSGEDPGSPTKSMEGLPELVEDALEAPSPAESVPDAPVSLSAVDKENRTENVPSERPATHQSKIPAGIVACPKCGRNFKSDRALKAHITFANRTPKLCFRRKIDKRIGKKGVKGQIGRIERLHVCEGCGRKFKSFKSLKLHHFHALNQIYPSPKFKRCLLIADGPSFQELTDTTNRSCLTCAREFASFKSLWLHKFSTFFTKKKSCVVDDTQVPDKGKESGAAPGAEAGKSFEVQPATEQPTQVSADPEGSVEVSFESAKDESETSFKSARGEDETPSECPSQDVRAEASSAATQARPSAGSVCTFCDRCFPKIRALSMHLSHRTRRGFCGLDTSATLPVGDSSTSASLPVEDDDTNDSTLAPSLPLDETSHDFDAKTDDTSSQKTEASKEDTSESSTLPSSDTDANSLPRKRRASKAKKMMQPLYQCDVCSTSYSYLKSIFRHVETAHGTAERKCDDCGLTFNSDQGLHIHIMTKETSLFKTPFKPVKMDEKESKSGDAVVSNDSSSTPSKEDPAKAGSRSTPALEAPTRPGKRKTRDPLVPEEHSTPTVESASKITKRRRRTSMPACSSTPTPQDAAEGKATRSTERPLKRKLDTPGDSDKSPERRTRRLKAAKAEKRGDKHEAESPALALIPSAEGDQSASSVRPRAVTFILSFEDKNVKFVSLKCYPQQPTNPIVHCSKCNLCIRKEQIEEHDCGSNHFICMCPKCRLHFPYEQYPLMDANSKRKLSTDADSEAHADTVSTSPQTNPNSKCKANPDVLTDSNKIKKCALCGEEVDSFSKLKKHLKSVHTKLLTCLRCGTCFSETKAWENHVQFDVCTARNRKEFTVTDPDLGNPDLRHADGLGPQQFCCDSCHEVADKLEGCTCSEQSASPRKLYRCSSCDRWFPNADLLHTHKKDLCDKK